jgi:hypothetical protein
LDQGIDANGRFRKFWASVSGSSEPIGQLRETTSFLGAVRRGSVLIGAAHSKCGIQRLEQSCVAEWFETALRCALLK